MENNDISQLQQQVNELRERLDRYERSDRYSFMKDISIMDGKKVYAGATIGLRIGTSPLNKLGLYGATPVVQAGAIASPSGGATVDSQARAGIDSLRTALKSMGITA